jgi:hypothetical protein
MSRLHGIYPFEASGSGSALPGTEVRLRVTVFFLLPICTTFGISKDFHVSSTSFESIAPSIFNQLLSSASIELL